MPSYEAMFILRADLKEEEQKGVISQLEDILKTNQAKIENSQVFGKRQLAYEIKKYKEGLYHLMNFSVDSGAVIAKLKHACNINENVLRALIVKKRR
jgi:single-strand DNA-binding protein